MSLGVAASYLASFQPIGPVAGFEKVKSEAATEAMLQIPALNQQAGVQLANTALGALGRIKETEMLADAQMEQLQARLGWEKELANRTDRQNRRMAGLALLSAPSGLTSLLGGGASSARARDVQDDNYNAARRTARQGSTATSDGLAAGMMRLIGLG